jgi:hypothetical protein
MITYEQRLNSNSRWAFMEGSMHFEKESAVHKSLERIVRRLESLGIPYAIAGAMAMFYHGYRRFTEDVDILVTRPALEEIHERLEGLGYVPLFEGSKNLRDAESGVKVEFIVTGDYPGDGKPKPVAFPDPTAVGVEIDGRRFVDLPTLVQLKLASGTAPGRLKDLADVQEMIRVLQLPAEFGEQLDAWVQPLYQQMWAAIHANRGGPDKEQ